MKDSALRAVRVLVRKGSNCHRTDDVAKTRNTIDGLKLMFHNVSSISKLSGLTLSLDVSEIFPK